MKTVREGAVVILPLLDTNEIDVFTGTGWNKWSRFKVVNGHPRFLKGESLTEQDFKTLCGLLK